MENAVKLYYDGSFEGFLTCIFTVYEQRLKVTGIEVSGNETPEMFSVSEEILTEQEKADRVEKSIRSKIPQKQWREIYFAFLSEEEGIEMLLLQYIKYILKQVAITATDYSNKYVLKTAQIAKKVSREKHRMEAFVRFKLTKDEIYFAQISPDFNVLPVILPHFESRYADQKWIIYDDKRKFGLYYDLEKTEFFVFSQNPEEPDSQLNSNYFTESEKEYEDLWQNYFNSTNIASRKNIKLHLQHVPKRYWRYLSEKRPVHY